MADDSNQPGMLEGMWGSVKSAGSSFADGAIKGDFSNDNSAAGIAGQLIGGLMPGTGIRDAAANVIDMRENGVSLGGMASLGINLFSEVPLFGDMAKLAYKGTVKTIDGVATAAKASEKVADLSKGLDKAKDLKKAEKVTLAAKGNASKPINGTVITALQKKKIQRKLNRKKVKKRQNKNKLKSKGESNASSKGPAKTAGEPVDVITGKVYVAQEDFTLPWRIPFTWSRFYNSDSRRQGAVGVGWESPADSRLTLRENGNVAFWHATPGGKIFSSLPEEGQFIEDATDGTQLVRFSDRIEVQTKGGNTFSFPSPTTEDTELLLREYKDINGNTITYNRTNGKLTEIRSSCGPWLEIKYSSKGIRRVVLHHPQRPSRTLVSYGQSQDGDLIAAFDPLAKAHTFEYDDHCLVRHTDRNGVSFHYEYDEISSEGRCVHTWGDDGLFDAYLQYDPEKRRVITTDSRGQLSIIEYDEMNRLVATTDHLGGRIEHEYDEAGRSKAITDALGRRAEYEYDASGNLKTLTRPDGVALHWSYDARGCPVAFTDPLGKLWKQEFDESMRLTRQVSPMGASRQYSYNEKGDLISFTDPLGNVTHFQCDPHGASLVKLIDPRGSATTWELDSMGCILKSADPTGATTSFGYDAKSRLIHIVRPNGAKIACEYDAELNLTRYRDELGHETSFEYGHVNRLIARHLPNGGTSHYEYDTENRLSAVVNGRGERYVLQRDPLGRVLHEIDYWGRMTTYGYDAAGQLTESVDPLGRRTSYERDDLGRITKRNFADGTAETFAYNPSGQLVSSASPDAEIMRSYDEDGRLVSESQGEFTVEYGYDAAGNVIRRSSSAGNIVQYAYDEGNLPKSIYVNGKSILEVSRDARGLPIRESLGNGLSRNRSFDEQWHLTKQTTSVGGNLVVDRRYEYDVAGNLLGLTDARKGSHQFGYDPVGQLIQHTDPTGRIQQFLRDAAGDFLQSANCEPFTPNEPENPKTPTLEKIVDSVRGIPKAPAGAREPVGRAIRKASFEGVSYHFDAAGNVIERSDGKDSLKLDWDCANRLHRGRGDDNLPIWFGYDSFGRRMSKTKKERSTTFGWDGDALLAEFDGTRWREYIMQPGGFTPVAMVDGGRVYHYECDQVGAPREMHGESGELVWSADYDAWGKAMPEGSSQVANPLRLQGQYWDDELSLAYNRNRYYDPHLGSFVSQDPLGLVAGENLYAVAPNTQGWVDPLGLTGASTSSNAPKKPIIIGEDQYGRIDIFAKDHGGETITDWLNKTGKTWSESVNDEFIDAMKSEGREFIDIGPAFGRRLQNRIDPTLGRPPSSIYGGERKQLLDYDKRTQLYKRDGKYGGGVKGLDF